jgi:hypothetical protein
MVQRESRCSRSKDLTDASSGGAETDGREERHHPSTVVEAPSPRAGRGPRSSNLRSMGATAFDDRNFKIWGFFFLVRLEESVTGQRD